MIVKYAEYIYGDNNSEVFTVLSSPSRSKGLMKTASYSGEVQDFVSDLKEKPGKTYALVNALSAGEYYGSNRNGDYFPERSLEQYHKTFEAMGQVYKHHVNKDPRRSMGSVKFAHYNSKMKRVELILELENEKAASVIERLEKGDLPAVSMGCRVPFDVCSVCHNEAAKTANYCDHLKHHMNDVLPGGQKIYAINTRPKFFDLSIVTIPADQTAGFLSKLGSSRVRSFGAPGTIKKSTWTEAFAKTAQFEANAEIRKKIEGKIEVASPDPKHLILDAQKRLSKDTLEKLSDFPMSEILSTMLGLRIVPLREDFQKLALYAMHNREGAELLEKEGICFTVTDETEASIPEDISLDNFNEKIAELLRDEVPYMSLTKPLVLARGIAKISSSKGLYFDPQEESKQQSRVFPTPNKHERSILSRVFFNQPEEPKMNSVRNPIAPMAALGSLYYGYTRIFNDISAAGFNRFIARHPWIFALTLGGASAGSILAQKSRWTKEASLEKDARSGMGIVMRTIAGGLLTVPVSYYAAGTVDEKTRRGIPISKTEDFVRKHPMLVALGTAMTGASAYKSLGKQFGKLKLRTKTADVGAITKLSHFVTRLDELTFNKVYEDLILN